MTLTPTQQLIIRRLQRGPATYKEIADELNVSLSTARDHMSELTSLGIGFEERTDGQQKIFELDDTPLNVDRTTPDYSEVTNNKRAKSRTLTEHLQEMEQRLRHLLERSEPAVADGGQTVRDSHEDVVIHRTDAHFGDVVRSEYGDEVFNSGIAEERERVVTDKVMHLVARQNEAGIEYDTAHLLLGGDMVTGENAFPHQQSEIRETLDQQIDLAFEVYMEQVRRLANRFPTVQVVCQPGNHGALEASYSDGANADRLLYMMLDKAIRESNLENVTVVRNDATGFTNFYVRSSRTDYEQGDGWKLHLRHGDDSLEHIGTSAGKRRWYNWLLRHGFDQAYRGHYHEFGWIRYTAMCPRRETLVDKVASRRAGHRGSAPPAGVLDSARIFARWPA